MKYLLAIIISIFAIQSFANTLTVKQDGTGNFDSIQEAILHAWPGDTVLVWPGTYYENIDFLGKNITLASLVLTTGDESYRYNTIIDGNNNGSCVKVMSGENEAILNGFTLQHGSGTNFAHPVLKYGGGIIITHSSFSVLNCIISDNYSDGGGGVFCGYDANLFISNTSVSNNQSYGSGGGVMLVGEIIFQFDSVFRCSLFLNYAARGCDFHKTISVGPLIMYLDTCTVQSPDSYFVSSIDIHGYQENDITFNIQNSIITPKDGDLYVNPVTGDNNNSGLTPDDPLETIAYAYSSIVVDSTEKNTIYLSDGVYSDSVNNEKFPLNIRPYINIEGESRDNTILDGMYKSLIIKGNNDVSNFCYSNMTMYRGGFVHPDGNIFLTGTAYLYVGNSDIIFDSILFKRGHGYSHKGILTFGASNNAQIKNCEFVDNLGAYAIRASASEGDTITISNCIFDNNQPDYQQEEVCGGALALYTFDTPALIQGCLFTGNNNYNIGVFGSFTSDYNYFINCTFTENTQNHNYVSLGINDANLKMYNCILYNEANAKPISFKWYEATEAISLEIYNSLIEGGEESIYIEPGPTQLIYDVTNIDANPLFYGGWEYPYNLSNNSPCIDAGTLDLPLWIELPEFDLAGNLRVYNGAIDMGAYEWDPTVGVHEHKPVVEEKEKLLNAAPNPFSRSTTITAIFKTRANIKLEVYNNYGQRVRVLMDGLTYPGTSQIIWYGDDDNHQYLPAGVYYIVMFEDGKEVESLKLIKGD